MKKLIVFSEWQDHNGYWHVGYTGSFKAGQNNFVLPARVLGKRLDEYYQWVIDEFDPIIQTYTDNGLIVFGWRNYSKAHSLLLLLNKEARKKNFLI